MFCTPPATIRSFVPLITAWAAKCTACWLEPHCRSIGGARHLLGQPGGEPRRCGRCRRPAGRSRRRSRSTTSSTAAGSMPVRSISAEIDVRAEVGRVHLAQPAAAPADRRAHGVDDVGLGHRCSCRLGVRSVASRIARATSSRCQVASPQARGEGPDPLHPEVQVVLERVADRAVALQRVAGRERAASAAAALAIATCDPRGRDRRRRASRRPGTRAGAANSSAIRTSASLCLIAWNEPIGTPNWRRSTRTRR